MLYEYCYTYRVLSRYCLYKKDAPMGERPKSFLSSHTSLTILTPGTKSRCFFFFNIYIILHIPKQQNEYGHH